MIKGCLSVCFKLDGSSFRIFLTIRVKLAKINIASYIDVCMYVYGKAHIHAAIVE